MLPPRADSQAETDLLGVRQRLDFLTAECARLENRLARVESSIIFRTLRRIGTAALTGQRKLGQALRKSPFHGFYLRYFPAPESGSEYQRWVTQQESAYISPEEQKLQASRWTYQPVVSILLPVHNPNQRWLKEAVDSVRDQTYPHWELCICDDHSREEWVQSWIAEQTSADSRIRAVRSQSPSGISRTMNQAGALASGDYFTWLDHDDVLHPFALHYVVEQLQASRFDVVYTDEDHLDESGHRTRPHFKPEWSPELLLSCMYWGHLVVIRRDLAAQAGWFRSECDGSQDHDLALRITDGPVTVGHVPQILYHWREHAGSTALSSAAKPYTRTATIRALEDTLQRRGIKGTVADGPFANTYLIHRKPALGLRISIIICSRNGEILRNCLQSVRERTSYPHYDLIVVQHESAAVNDPAGVARQFGCRAIPWNGPFNFAGMNNAGVAATESSLLVFLNDDTTPLASGWLDYLTAHLEREEVGAVGARLLYPSGAIQHAGMAVGMMDGCGHPGRGLFRSDLFPWIELPREVSAVTGACLGIRKQLFTELGGFDEAFPVNYNDVDLCLRVWNSGKRVICDPRVLLQHAESASRTGGTTFSERLHFFERWAVSGGNIVDPFYSPAFDSADENIRLR